MRKCIFTIYLTSDHTKPVETQDLLYLCKWINHIVQHIARAAWYIPQSDVIQILAHQRTGQISRTETQARSFWSLSDSLSMARKVEMCIPILTSRESYNATKVFISYIKLNEGNPKSLTFDKYAAFAGTQIPPIIDVPKRQSNILNGIWEKF